MARNYTGLVKAVNTTNRRREPTSLSDDLNVRYINGRVVRVGTPGRSNRGLR